MLQGGEILIILVVALVVLGPERLPQLARKLGSWSAELRRAAHDLRTGLEAEVGDLEAIRRDIKAPLDEVRGTVKEVGQEAQSASDIRRLKWVGPEPKAGPTAADAMADLDAIEGSETDSERPEEPVDPKPPTE